MSYIIDKSFQLGPGQGSSQVAQKMYVIAHDTGNDNNQGPNAARNEAIFMHNNWRSAYTTDIAGWDRIYLIGEPGYVSWGALNANPYSPAQVELTHYSDKTKALQAYRIYIERLRDYAKQFNVPITLDEGYAGTKGIKSHKWVSDNLGGDHQDPYAYLQRIGISKAQFLADLKNGTKGVQVANPNVITVEYKGPGGVRLLSKNGKYIDKYLKNATRWKVFGTAVINNEEMALLGGDQWLPLKHTDWAYNRAQVNYEILGKAMNVRFLDDKGNYLDQYGKPGSKWKVFGVKIIKGEAMYLIGKNVYVPKRFVHVYYEG